MPTSEASNISPIMNAVRSLAPRKILDLGIGCGKYGALCREYLDMADGRIRPDQWQTYIHGVEGWQGYRNAMWDLYDNIIIEDFSARPYYSGYNLVLLIDSLEHLPKDIGHEILLKLRQNNNNIIVSCPFGANYVEQGAAFGNEYERHRAHWKPSDFIAMGGQILQLQVCVVALLKGI